MAYSSVQNPITLTGRGEGGNSPPTIPMSTTRTCPYVSKTPSPSVFVLDSCRVPSVFNNALASRDYSYIPGALCFYIYLDIRWQRLPLQNCNCITEIKKKKKIQGMDSRIRVRIRSGVRPMVVFQFLMGDGEREREIREREKRVE